MRDLENWNETIEKVVQSVGLNYYEQEFEIIGYNDMIAYEAYVGMPSRYPHWSFGKAYEKNKTMYRYNLTGLPYEMVINSNPCIAYLMKENTLLLQILTMAHVYGHNDFFKNNRLFVEGTRAEYTVEMFKTHADTVRSYINDPSIGYEKVERILDAAHSIKLQTSRVIGEKRLTEEQKRRKILDSFTPKIDEFSLIKPAENPELPDLSKIPLEPEEDLLYFLLQYGELQDWERNLIQIVRKETDYFIPQIETKIMNEGWASYWHYNILKELKFSDELHLEFIKRHNDVIAPGIGWLNPYFIGFKIFESLNEKYGREKIFEVRRLERDESFLRRYLTEELCAELNLFQYGKIDSSYIIQEVSDKEGWMNIRNTLCNNCGLGMIPLIRVVDTDKTDKTLILEHVFDGRELNGDYARATLKHVSQLWGRSVKLKTRQHNMEIIMQCDSK